MKQTYGVNYRTLAKALAWMCRAGVIERQQSRYLPVTVAPARSFASTIVLLTPFPLAESPRFVDPTLHDFVRTLEGECARAGLRLLALNSADDERACRKALASDAVLGALVFAPHQALFANVLPGYTGPLAVFESRAGFKAASQPRFATSRNMHCFRIDEVAAGEEVGRFLVRCGYRRPVYVSGHPQWPFSKQRHEGLQMVFDSAQAQGRTLCAALLDDASARVIDNAADIARRESSAADHPNRRGAAPRALPGEPSPSRHRFMEVYERVLGEQLAPVFRRARDMGGDVWVCANDFAAIQALHFLRAARVRVPGSLAVIGFDNTEDASYAGLSSYDFDIKGLVPRMLDTILRPDRRRPSDAAHRLLTHTGMVVQRASTAGAPSPSEAPIPQYL